MDALPVNAPSDTSPAPDTAAVVIKKYANRRLYNTATSSYVTLDQLADMVRAEIDFVVYDARTGENITRMILTQIIFEAENKGEHLMPVRFLREIIRCYGDNLQTIIPNYLEMTMDVFRQNQNSLQKTFVAAASSPFLHAEEMVRLHTDWMMRATNMWFNTGNTDKKPTE